MSDDPESKGYLASPERWTGRGPDGRGGPGDVAIDAREREQAPHPDDPDGKGFHGAKAPAVDHAAYFKRTGSTQDSTVAHHRPHGTQVTDPENAAPPATALTNVTTEEAA